ncbi:uncharacterized protein LOC143235331 isoform X7 [Tachypleus tridentatus]|uniref:uncharacterized protein LOC143235331 isoform X7 n=1 Tax=Tachypleus tridentatus TaxID=6853 RepID=UPI003FCF7A2B
MFANSEPVRGFEEGALQMCFADLRQCLLIQNLLEGLKKVHSRCALLILGRLTIFNLYLSDGSSSLQCI